MDFDSLEIPSYQYYYPLEIQVHFFNTQGLFEQTLH
jgi:hypothetical protein